MEIFTFDIMLNGRFICTLKYKYNSIFPIELEVLEKFAHSILKDMKSLESDISQLVDKNFWDLV